MLYHKPIPFATKHSLWPHLIQGVIWQYKDFDGNSILWTFYSSPLFPAVIFSHTAQDVNHYEPEKRETQIKNNLGEKEFWTGTLSWIIYSTIYSCCKQHEVCPSTAGTDRQRQRSRKLRVGKTIVLLNYNHHSVLGEEWSVAMVLLMVTNAAQETHSKSLLHAEMTETHETAMNGEKLWN